MMKHLFPAWIPLLLLIAFLGCQSLEVNTSPKVEPKEIKNHCASKSKIIFYSKMDGIKICAEEISTTSKFKILKKIEILEKQPEDKHFTVQFRAKNFQTFLWNAKTPSEVTEILLVKLNNRYKILNISTDKNVCANNICHTTIDKCSTSTQNNLFPLLHFRVKFKMDTAKNFLPQLVWQSLNGDLRARNILLNYKDWFRLDLDMQTQFEYYKQIVQKQTRFACNEDKTFFANKN